MMRSPEKTVSGIVEQPIEEVWRLITSPRKYHALGIPHTYEPFETATGRPSIGATFKLVALTGGRGTMHVVECQYPERFSFGGDRSEWTFRFELQSRGSDTEVTFTRKFRRQSLLERIFDGSQDQTYENLAAATLTRLSGACKRLAAGKSDGLTES